MEPLYYVMAILGCGDGGMECERARVETTRFATAAQCQAALATTLPRHADLSYPVVQARCEPNLTRMASVENGAGVRR